MIQQFNLKGEGRINIVNGHYAPNKFIRHIIVRDGWKRGHNICLTFYTG